MKGPTGGRAAKVVKPLFGNIIRRVATEAKGEKQRALAEAEHARTLAILESIAGRFHNDRSRLAFRLRQRRRRAHHAGSRARN